MVMKRRMLGRPKKLDHPKKKFTLYLSDEALRMFNELYAFRIMSGGTDTKSDIVCEAIDKLHRKEFINFKKREKKRKEMYDVRI